MSTSSLFLALVAVVAAGVVLISARFLSRRSTAWVASGVIAWLAYVGLMSWFGVVRDPALRPPGAAYLLLPAVALVAFAGRSRIGAGIAAAIPAWVLIAAESFRIGVELLLHRLWVGGLVPQMMTYEGGNVDIFIGLSAPLLAWLATRGTGGRRIALVWNGLGLAALANVAVRAVGTAPGPLNFIHSEVPNLAVGLFPYTYIAGLFAPLAVLLHVLAIRSLRSQRADLPGARSATMQSALS